jgi:TonB family protein
MKCLVLLPILFLACTQVMAQSDCPVPHSVARHGGSIMKGHLVEHQVPTFPGRARAHDISGVVTFRAHILEDGTVGHLTVVSGPPELQEQAEKTVYRWRYTPWTLDGQPIDVYTTIPISFGLNKSDGSAGPTAKPKGLPISPSELQGLLVRSYPAQRSKDAKRTNVSGTVQLRITLDETGQIIDLGVVCGPEMLEDAALETVRHWIYKPYLDSGQAKSVESTVDVRF